MWLIIDMSRLYLRPAGRPSVIRNQTVGKFMYRIKEIKL